MAADFTVTGSAAETYALYLAGFSQALLDGGLGLDEDDSIETLADGFRLCPPVSSGVTDCNEFNNFVFEDGKLSDFDAGGNPVSSRIKEGSAEAVPLGNVGSIRFLASYLSISNNLVVVLEATSNIDGLNLSYSSSYQAPDGRQSTAAELVGPFELRSGSLANFAYVFPAAQFGGVLNLQAFDADYNEFVVQIPTN